MSKTISQKDYDKLYKFNEPSAAQLIYLAHRCGKKAQLNHNNEPVIVIGATIERWSPIYDLAQNQELLAAVIAKGDCKLFYDDGVHEFFIYQYGTGWETSPPLAHRAALNETVIEAAIAIWCPED